MQPSPSCGRSRDLLSSPLLTYIFFGLPALAMIATGSIHMHGYWQTGVWTAALVIMGIACTVNALRCRRVHCYLTGPFFFFMALVTLLYGIGIIPLGPRGWSIISIIVVVGAVTLCCLPEMIWGRYRRN